MQSGDRVAAYIPNMPEAIIAALGAAAVGAVWSSCSPDFGVQGVLDRFGQIEPKVLIAADGYFYGGKTHDLRGKVASVLQQLPTVERLVLVPYVEERPSLDGLRDASLWSDYLDGQSDELRVGGAAVRSPSLHPLLLGHDWRPQVHRSRCRGHAAAAPERAPAPLRYSARRPRVLLHHLRLDDVELAGDRSRLRGHAAPLRRISVPSRRACAVRFRRRHADDAVRDVGPVHRCGEQGGARTHEVTLPGVTADDDLYGLAAGTGEFRFRVREDQTRSSTWRPSLAGPTSSVASSGGIQLRRCGAARFRRAGSA